MLFSKKKVNNQTKYKHLTLFRLPLLFYRCPADNGRGISRRIHGRNLNPDKEPVFASSCSLTNTVERMWGASKSTFRRHFSNHVKLLDSFSCKLMRCERLLKETNLLKKILQDIADNGPTE